MPASRPRPAARPPRLLLLVGLLLLGGWSLPGPAHRAAPVRTIAVLTFDNYSGDPKFDPLGRGLASVMISDLAAVDDLRVLERDRLADVMRELETSNTRWFDSTTALRVGRLVGAQYIVAGGFMTADPRLRIDTRVIRVETGEIVKTAQVTGEQDKLFELQRKLARQLVRDLDVALSTDGDARLEARQQANRIDDLDALLRFSEGVRRSDQGDYVGAAATLGPLLVTSQSAVVRLAYDEARRRAARRTNEAVGQKAREGLGRLLRRPPA